MGSNWSNYDALFELIGELSRKRYQVAERCFATIGLNHTEARLLTLLVQRKGEASQEDLSSMIHVDRSNSGRALKCLESRGYVVRTKCETDQRTKSVLLTEMGRKAASEISKLRRVMAGGFFGELTEEQAGSILAHFRNAGVLGEFLLPPMAKSGQGEGA